MIEAILGRLTAGEDLSMQEMTVAIGEVMEGKCSDPQMAVLLTALRTKGETVAEVAGAAAAMRQHMTRVQSRRTGLLDTCGTGGDGSRTFNISTAAALVAAAAGVPVAKHGNRAVSSKTGSADVLAALGVNIEAPVATVERCLDEVGICFCFAPRFHPSMKNVASVRKKLAVPTIFNLLGPLCNPARAPFQLIGVGRPEVHRLLAEALALLGVERALLVRGEDGLDEVTLAGATHVFEVRDAQQNSGQTAKVNEIVWNPEDFDLACRDLGDICVETAAESAEMIRRVLAGEPGTARDIVIANAAAALWTAGRGETPVACAREAANAIDQGAAAATLARLVETSNAAGE